MIVKKVGNRNKATSKTKRIRSLIQYISDELEEKCLYIGTRNFIVGEDLTAQTAEMIALAEESIRSPDPIRHYILAWHEDERPTVEQVEEAVTIFLEELGWPEHQAIYALHKDTDNPHLHLVVNRVHPETLKIVSKNRDFDIDLAHRAIARIEHVQGWQPERNARYVVLENGELQRAGYNNNKPQEPKPEKQNIEARTGEKSAERIAIEEGADIIKRSKSWEELHRGLATKGMRYAKKGGGAVVFVGDVAIKASSIDRNASLSKLEKRLGEYQPAPEEQEIKKREPEPLIPDFPRLKEFIEKRQDYLRLRKEARRLLETKKEREQKALEAKQKAQRDEILKGDWRGKGQILNAMRSVLAKEQKEEREALKKRHQKENEEYRQQFPPYPYFEDWLRMNGSPDLAEQWRHRRQEQQAAKATTPEHNKPAAAMPRTPARIKEDDYSL